MPAVLSIQSGINKVRYATLKGIMAREEKRNCGGVPRESLGVSSELTQKTGKDLCAAENEEDRVHHRYGERIRGEVDRKIEA